jgi:hypothetical protein
MKKWRMFLPPLPVIILYAIPFSVLAATITTNGHVGQGLVPCGVSSDYLKATQCQACDLIALLQNVFKFIFALSIPIAAGLFAYGGFKYMSSGGKPEARSQANKIFTTTAVGFVVMLTGWLIINSVLYFLVGHQFGNSSWFNIQCVNDQSQRARDVPLTQALQQIIAPPTQNGGTSGGVTPGGGTGSGSSGGGITGDGSGSITPQLITAMYAQESSSGQNVDNGNGTGCNQENACGPMQIQPATACSTDPSFSTGCSADGKIINQSQVVSDLQNTTASENLATQIMNQNLVTCGGDLGCALAIYNAQPGAAKPSACCSSGYAYQCNFDCGTTAAHSYQCDVNPVSQCVANTGYAETRAYVNTILSKPH